MRMRSTYWPCISDLWKHVPEGSIITPHVKEFDRLFGEHKNWWQRLQTAIRNGEGT